MTIMIIISTLMILVLAVCIGKIALAYFVDELQERKRQNSLKKEYEEEKAKEAKEKADFEALPKAQREKILKQQKEQEKKLKAEQAREREERREAQLKLLKKGRMYLIYLSHERTSGGWRSRAGKFIGFTTNPCNKTELNLVFNTAEGTVVANIDYDKFQPIEKEWEIK